MEQYTLIMPMINTSVKYQNSVPIEFRFDNETGEMNCIKVLKNIDTSKFTKIIFVILKEHNDKYNVYDKIESAMTRFNEHNRIDYNVSVLFKPTSSQVETVYQTINKYHITGNIFIKDADNMCKIPSIIKGNSLLIYNIENLPIVDPQHKSYITLDEQNFVTNIIEKRVVSPIFNCGGYSFERAEDFIDAYNAIKKYENVNEHLYISHCIYWLILNKNLKFRPTQATYYEDFEIN